MAAGGYPGDYATGDVITGLSDVEDAAVKVFHAATRRRDGDIVTDGGRVLTVVGLGEDVAAAQARAYAGVRRIHFNNAYCRSDIGYRALQR
jgi:phosphoribosylamine--glycine ligase